MNGKVFEIDQSLRDGIASLPERLDLRSELPPDVETEVDTDLDEALMETFPASDPLASGRTA